MARTNKTLKDLTPSVCDILDKLDGISWYMENYMRQTARMIEYKGMPEDIPVSTLVDYLQRIGFVGFTDKADGTPKFFYGGLYYDPEAWYPTKPAEFQFNHPKFNDRLKIGTECHLLRHDSRLIGLYRYFIRYAVRQVENDITIRTYDINARIQNILTSGDNAQVEAANKYFKDIEAGKLSAILDVKLVDCINPLKDIAASKATRPITEFIELSQYLDGKCLNGIGLNENFNMKRESLNEAEAGMNDDCLLPTVDDIIETQKEDFEEINAAYGWNVQPDLSSAWKHRRVFIDAGLEMAENEAENAAEVNQNNNPADEPETPAEEVKTDE